MFYFRFNILRFTIINPLILLVISGYSVHAQVQPIFRQLAGSWGGSGTMVLSDGTQERISCRSYYIAKSNDMTLGLAIRCQSSTQSIEIRSQIIERGGRITGDWEERTYHMQGDLTGKAAVNRLDLSFSGAISGSMTIALKRGTHTVTVETDGSGFRNVSITLRKD